MNVRKLPIIIIGMALSFNAMAKETKTIEKSFDLTGKGQLLLENVNGDVDIASWDENRVLVTAKLKAKNEDALERIEVTMKQSNNRIRVETDYKKNDGWGNNNGGSVDYKVMVPSNIDLRELELVNGSLTIENVSGELRAELVNGSIEATGLAQNASVDTVNGSVRLTFADQVKGIEVDVNSVNGSIRLMFPKGFGARVEASTGNGSIKTDFGLSAQKGRFYGTELEGEFGDGSSELELESVNGSIKILEK